MLDRDQINILWEECKDQNEWQRHNENQRAQLTTILLLISTALIAFAAQRAGQPGSWLVAVFLIVIGVFGAVSVQKYWERWQEHFDKEAHFRQVIDKHGFPQAEGVRMNDGKPVTYRAQKRMEGRSLAEGLDPDNDEPVHMLVEPRVKAIQSHLDSWSENQYRKWFLDRRLMQHRLWSSVFLIVALIGLAFLVIVK